mgnify:CR=1 FL=1
MERICIDTLHFFMPKYDSPLALPVGELSPQVTERVLQDALSDLAELGHLSHRERQGGQFIIPLCLLTV